MSGGSSRCERRDPPRCKRRVSRVTIPAMNTRTEEPAESTKAGTTTEPPTTAVPAAPPRSSVLPNAPINDMTSAIPPASACNEKTASPSAKTAAVPDVACSE